MNLLLMAFLWANPASAMCVSTSYEPVAWSPDGQAVLIHEEASGPEGGGSISYLLVDFKKKKSETFAVSSNFSPGDGTEPQTISEDACRQAVTKANAALAKLGFEAKFRTDPKYCHKSRDNMLAGKEKKDYTLEGDKATLMATQIGLPGKGETTTAYSKNGKNMIVTQGSGTCDSRCYRARPADKPDTWKNDGGCEE